MSTLEMIHASNSCCYETYLTNYQVLRPVLPQDRKSPSRDLGVEGQGGERKGSRKRLFDQWENLIRQRSVVTLSHATMGVLRRSKCALE